MTIILFLIDTSGSMNQRAHSGAKPTLLDITKETVERFLKLRGKDLVGRGDRYMLLTFDEVPYNIKAGWKENLNVFSNELKNLQATGLTTINNALRNTFDYLNLNRMQSGIDMYGMGRCPYYMEPASIILITDGSKYSTVNNVQEELSIPQSHLVGSELTIEPYRWDHRLFAIVLRFSGTYKSDQNGVNNVPCDSSPINALCEATGGRSFCVTSKSEINWSLEFIGARSTNWGAVVKFEKFGPDPPMIIDENGDRNSHYDPNNRNWHNTKNVIIVKSGPKGYTVGNWPIPEAYWPDQNLSNLLPRTAHPIIKFTCTNSEPIVMENVPFDKYELEPSPLTQFILSRKQPNVVWQVFVANSQRNSELGQPFGYLKASTQLVSVNLFVLPYNYPVFITLLEDLTKNLQGKPTREWRQQFESYLKTVPIYYTAPLRRALQRFVANAINANMIIPDQTEMIANVALNTISKKQKAIAKAEFDKLAASMGQHKLMNIEWPRIPITHISNDCGRPRYYVQKAINELFCTNPTLQRTFAAKPKDIPNETNVFIVRYQKKTNMENNRTLYRNAADVPRHELLNHASKLRDIFFKKQLSISKFLDEDQMFNLPVTQMGNYQEYLKKKPPPLREIEAAPTRQHMFGNPFKLDKKNMMMIDEADIDLMSSGGSSNQSPRGIKRPMSDSYGTPKHKRKPGPLPKDYSYSRSRSPSPASSPSHMAMYGPSNTSSTPAGSSYMQMQPSQVSGNQSPVYFGNYSNSMFNNNNMQPPAPSSPANVNQKMLHATYNSNHMKNNDLTQKFIHPSPTTTNNIGQVLTTNTDMNFQKIINETTSKHVIYSNNNTNNNKLIMEDDKFLRNQFSQNRFLHSTINSASLKTTPVSMVNGNSNSNNFTNLSHHHLMNRSMTNHINNGVHPKTMLLDPNKSIILAKEDKDVLHKVFHLVRIKDQKSLLQVLNTHKGVIGDHFIYQAVKCAQRLKMKSVIDFLSNHFPVRVQKALEAYHYHLPVINCATTASNDNNNGHH